MPRPGYTTITIGQDFHNKMSRLIEKLNEDAGYRKYRSVSHFVEDTIMKYHMRQLIPLEHFNLGDEGVRVLDRTLGNSKSRGRIIDVFFKPDRVWCDHCESADCKHVKFALSLPEVQEIIRKKGWHIPER